MACCKDTPFPKISSSSGDANGPESDIRPGESAECYMNRAGNTTGLQDDATEDVENKIANTAIPISQNPVRFENIQFKLTPNSTRKALEWRWSNNGGEILSSLGVTLSPSGVLNGNISPSALGKKFNVIVTVLDGSGVVDSRGFAFSPAVAKEGEIRLISPLPGAIVNSKYGPRLHPIKKVMKPHTGIDMKYADRSVKNVVAAADGEVIQAGGDAARGYGLKVWVKHSANGKHLCTTTYNHLAKIYVSVGQKVMAGQAIGLEGTTGSSTGNHLHFEVRLPNGTFTDPEPLINGKLSVATSTDTSGNAVNPTERTSSASLTPEDAEAKQSSCAAYGPTYPADPNTTDDEIPPNLNPFELAWYFTMTHEVGPFWTTSLENDPDVIAGNIATPEQRKKCGYVNTPNFPGGETKFGIAQKPNPQLVVKTITYAAAKKTGYNNYWAGGIIKSTQHPPYVGIMLFDLNYLHGMGNARKIWNDALAKGMSPTGDKAAQIKACEILTAARIAFINNIGNPAYTRGWLKRANDCLGYVKNLPNNLI
jgi:murein DD-endopeptidase MepM/ murein hydrolase activator NlpD